MSDQEREAMASDDMLRDALIVRDTERPDGGKRFLLVRTDDRVLVCDAEDWGSIGMPIGHQVEAVAVSEPVPTMQERDTERPDERARAKFPAPISQRTRNAVHAAQAEIDAAAREEPPRDVEQAHRERVIDAARELDPTIEEAIKLLREMGVELLEFYHCEKGQPPQLEAVERVCADLRNMFLAAREDIERPDGRAFTLYPNGTWTVDKPRVTDTDAPLRMVG
jgi:hypothetical protein